MGHLRKRQGLELIVESLPDIVKDIPDAKFVVIGTGDLENNLKKRVAELGLVENVDFKGFIEDHKRRGEYNEKMCHRACILRT